MIRLALIGCCGPIETYAELASRLQNATFVAVADSDRDQARRGAEMLRAPISAGGLDELLNQHADAFDAAVVHTASDTASADSRSAADGGKHLLVESPLAPSLEMADSLIESCAAANVRLMVGQASRFVPAVQTVKSSLESGKLGVPGLLRIHRWESLKTDPAEELQQRAVREIDLANWLFGRPPTDVYAAARTVSSSPHDGPDYVQIHLGFPEGGMAMIDESATISGDEDYFSLSMIGSTGAAYADDHRNMQLLYGGGRPAALKTGQGSLHLLAQLQEFVSAIEESREPAIRGAEGRLALQVAAAVAESMNTGRAVRRTGEHYEAV